MNEPITVVEDAAEWDRLVASLPVSSLFLTSTWGKYKTRKGWQTSRLCIGSTQPDQPLAILQLQWKTRGFITIFNVQGGIHLFTTPDKEDDYGNCFNALVDYLKARARRWIVLASYDAHDLPLASIALLKSGFAPVLTSGMFTYLVDCQSPVEETMLSSNWRHNLKRAQKHASLVSRWAETPAERSAAMQRAGRMYENLMKRKNFSSGLDVKQIADLVVQDPDMLIIEALLDGEVVAVRVAHVAASHVLDFLAASSDAARNCYANYLLMWEFVRKSQLLGKDYFDAGGIDPYHNAGVFNFKKGLGGALATNGPVWVRASNRFLTLAAKAMLCLR